jgi:hypothetical protein
MLRGAMVICHWNTAFRWMPPRFAPGGIVESAARDLARGAAAHRERFLWILDFQGGCRSSRC